MTTVSPTSAAASTANTPDAMKQLSGNFSTFLTLLTTQLKNQDPTSPLDTNQFTSQLVQFASVEQQINTNRSLGQLINLTATASEVLRANSSITVTLDTGDTAVLTAAARNAGIEPPRL